MHLRDTLCAVRISAICGLILVFAPFTSGQTLTALEKGLNGQTVLIRSFLAGDELHLTEDGEPKKPLFGVWTVHGYAVVKKVQLKNNELRIKADRLAAIFKPSGSDYAYRKYGDSVELRIPRVSDDQVAAALKRVFVFAPERLQDVVPPLWKQYFSDPKPLKYPSGNADPQKKPCEAPVNGVMTVCNGVTPPKLLDQQAPSFSDVARKLRLKGHDDVVCIITEKGDVQIEKIAHPIGAGLDEEAIFALSNWKFAPATKDGQAVKVRVVISNDFNIY